MFRREGANLYVDVPISLRDAVLGGTVPVPTLDGIAEVSVRRDAKHERCKARKMQSTKPENVLDKSGLYKSGLYKSGLYKTGFGKGGVERQGPGKGA